MIGGTAALSRSSLSLLRNGFRVIVTAALAMTAIPLDAMSDDGAIRYSVTVDLFWDEDNHGTQFPPNAHWSRLIAMPHGPRYSLFADGDTATSGLALLATNGRVGVLEAELAEARRRERVGEHIVLPGLAEGSGTITFELEVSERHSFVSFGTMLAPSPDWFTGVDAVDLSDGNGWLEKVSRTLWVWDAGADSGDTFTAPNRETQPRQSIRLVTHPAFLRPNGLRPVGQAILRRIE